MHTYKLLNIIIFATMHLLSVGMHDYYSIQIMLILNKCFNQKKQSTKVIPVSSRLKKHEFGARKVQ